MKNESWITVLAWLSWCVLPLLAAPGIAAESKAERGARLYTECVRCHGASGEGIESTSAPRLAGREDWFIKAQLEKFRQRERGKDDSKETGFLPPEERTRLMHPVSDKLSGSDTKALLAHIASLQPGPLPPARKGDAGRGRPLYSASCVECHGKNAEGNPRRDAPRLTGQHDWYLFNQLRDYRMGWRGFESKDPHVKFMRSRLDLDDAALHDIAAYIVSLNAATPQPPGGK